MTKPRVPPGEYLELLDKSNFDFDKTPWSFRTRNFQAFEMNINDGLEDEAEIKREVSSILAGFDLIVVVERFFESMILLGTAISSTILTRRGII